MRYDSCQNLLTKNLFLNLSFLCSYIQNLIAAHSCIYFGFSQKQETNKSMRYDSCQDLAYPKKIFQNLGFLCSYIQNSNLHTPIFILASLDKQKIYGVLFLPESAH